jgi:transposase InsO family protein
MAFREGSKMSNRREFVTLARIEGANIRELCRRFGVSPTVGYKWIERSKQDGETFEDRSRKPHHSPKRTEDRIEQLVLDVRDAHPVWNARKIRRVLQRTQTVVPAASTIGQILKRHGRISADASALIHPWQRFEHAAPNDLLQMDFKGHFQVGQSRCFALTVLDDHSRYSMLLEACENERTETVQPHLIAMFRRYGLPWRINTDNGRPWGNPTGDPYTKLTVWLIRIGIRISHSRPLHPQTNGKDERFHRTLNAEVLQNRSFASFAEVTPAFAAWREIYNHERPHEALGLEVPAFRYRPSVRSYPEDLPMPEYGPDDRVYKLRLNGKLHVDKLDFYLSQAFAGQLLAVRPSAEDGVFTVHYFHMQLGSIDLRHPGSVVRCTR